jgi:hypothetical protein
MDNEGGPANLSDPIEGMGSGADENVDQYFDDGGETFLPADHVSSSRCSQLSLSGRFHADLKSS